MNPIHRRNTLKNPDPNFFFCPCSNGVLSPSIARTISSSVSCGLASSSSSSWPTERVREKDSPSSAEDGGSGCPKSSMCRRRCRNFHAMHMRRSMACMIPETANMIQPKCKVSFKLRGYRFTIATHSSSRFQAFQASQLLISTGNQSKCIPHSDRKYHQSSPGTLNDHHRNTKCANKFKSERVPQLRTILNSSKCSGGKSEERRPPCNTRVLCGARGEVDVGGKKQAKGHKRADQPVYDA